jgi:SHS2 domain-containing protein
VAARFDLIEHTADIGIVVYGKDLNETFANAAFALFSLITEPSQVKPAIRQNITLTASDREALLVRWLNELIFYFETERFLFARFDIAVLTATDLQAECYGERIDPSRHTLKKGVKAATYHLLSVTRNNQGYRAQVIFDI